MSDNPQPTLFGRTPTSYGTISLIAACLAWLCWPLVLVLGVFLVLVVEFPLVLIGVVSGLLGLGAGVYFQKPAAIATATLGLVLIGYGAWSVAYALMHF